MYNLSESNLSSHQESARALLENCKSCTVQYYHGIVSIYATFVAILQQYINCNIASTISFFSINVNQTNFQIFLTFLNTILGEGYFYTREVLLQFHIHKVKKFHSLEKIIVTSKSAINCQCG